MPQPILSVRGVATALVAAMAAFFLLFPVPASAESGLPLPRFVSISAGEANLRTGPGERYPIMWVLRRQSQPVMIVDEIEHWRQIRLPDGLEGWVHRRLLSGRRTLRVTVPEAVLRRRPDDGSAPLARLTSGVILDARRCEETWCHAEVQRVRGWVRRDAIWGVLPGEQFN